MSSGFVIPIYVDDSSVIKAVGNIGRLVTTTNKAMADIAKATEGAGKAATEHAKAVGQESDALRKEADAAKASAEASKTRADALKAEKAEEKALAAERKVALETQRANAAVSKEASLKAIAGIKEEGKAHQGLLGAIESLTRALHNYDRTMANHLSNLRLVDATNNAGTLAIERQQKAVIKSAAELKHYDDIAHKAVVTNKLLLESQKQLDAARARAKVELDPKYAKQQTDLSRLAQASELRKLEQAQRELNSTNGKAIAVKKVQIASDEQAVTYTARNTAELRKLKLVEDSLAAGSAKNISLARARIANREQEITFTTRLSGKLKELEQTQKSLESGDARKIASLKVKNQATEQAITFDTRMAAKLKELQQIETSYISSQGQAIALLKAKNQATEQAITFDTRMAAKLKELQQIEASYVSGQGQAIALLKAKNQATEQALTFDTRMAAKLKELQQIEASYISGQGQAIALLKAKNQATEQAITFDTRMAAKLKELQQTEASYVSGQGQAIALLKAKNQATEQAITFDTRMAAKLKELQQIETSYVSGQGQAIALLKAKNQATEQAITFDTRMAAKLKELQQIEASYVSGQGQAIALLKAKNQATEQAITFDTRMAAKLKELQQTQAAWANGTARTAAVLREQIRGTEAAAVAVQRLTSQQQMLMATAGSLATSMRQAIAYERERQKGEEELARVGQKLVNELELMKEKNTQLNRATREGILVEHEKDKQWQIGAAAAEKLKTATMELSHATTSLKTTEGQQMVAAKELNTLEQQRAALIARSTPQMRALAAEIRRLAAAEREATAASEGMNLHLHLGNQLVASSRAALYGLGTSFGMYTSSTLVAAAATYAFFSGMRNAITTGAEFEHQLARLGTMASGTIVGVNVPARGDSPAVTNVDSKGKPTDQMTASAKRYGEELTKLGAKARELASYSTYSATEVVKGMTEMALAGYNTQQVLIGIRDVMNLAALGSMDFAEATEIALTTMMGFGLRVTDLTRVVNVLARAAIESNASVQDLGKTMSYAAPIAGSFGISLEYTAAMAEVLANAGIKGSRAGTGLRKTLLEMFAPTDKAAKAMEAWGISMSGTAKDMESLEGLDTKVAGILDTTGSGTEALKEKFKDFYIATAGGTKNIKLLRDAVGVYALPAFVNLIAAMGKGSKSIEALNADLETMADTAVDSVAKLQDSVKSAWDMMGNVASNVGQKMFDSQALGIRGLIDDVTMFLRTLYESPTAMGAFIDSMNTMLNVVVNVIAAFVAFKVATLGLAIVATVAGWVKTLAGAFSMMAGSGGLLMVISNLLLAKQAIIGFFAGGWVAVTLGWAAALGVLAAGVYAVYQIFTKTNVVTAAASDAIDSFRQKNSAAFLQSMDEGKRLSESGLQALIDSRTKIEEQMRAAHGNKAAIDDLAISWREVSNRIEDATKKVRLYTESTAYIEATKLRGELNKAREDQKSANEEKAKQEAFIKEIEQKGSSVSQHGMVSDSVLMVTKNDLDAAIAKAADADARVRAATADLNNVEVMRRIDRARTDGDFAAQIVEEKTNALKELEALKKQLDVAKFSDMKARKEFGESSPEAARTLADLEAINVAYAKQLALVDDITYAKSSQRSVEPFTAAQMDEHYNKIVKEYDAKKALYDLPVEERTRREIESLKSEIAYRQSAIDKLTEQFDIQAKLPDQTQEVIAAEREINAVRERLKVDNAKALEDLSKLTDRDSKSLTTHNNLLDKQDSAYTRLIKEAIKLADAEEKLLATQLQQQNTWESFNASLLERTDIYSRLTNASAEYRKSLTYKVLDANQQPGVQDRVNVSQIVPAQDAARRQFEATRGGFGSGADRLIKEAYSTPAEGSPESSRSTWTGGQYPYKITIDAEAIKNGLSPRVLAGVLAQESGFNPRSIGDNDNSWGMGQFNRRGAAKDYGLSRSELLSMSPERQIELAADFLGKLKTRTGSETKAVVAYNGGGDPNYLRNVQLQMSKFGAIETAPLGSRATPMAASGSGSAVDKIAGITDEMSKRSKLVGLENEQIELAKKLAQAKETEINYSDKLAVALSLQQESQIDVAAGMSRMSEWYDRLREARSKNTTLSIEDSREMEKDSQLLSAAMTRENARREDAIKLEEMAIRLGQPLHDVAQRTYDDNLKLASSYGAYSAVLSDLLVKRKKLAEMAALYQKTGGKQGMSPTEVQTAGVAQEMQALDVKLASGAGTWGEAMIAALGKVAAGFTTFKEGVGNIMGDLFKTMTDGFADSLGRAIVYSEDLGQSLKNLAKDALAQLISSFVKLMIQMTAARLVAAALGIDLAKLGGGSAAQGAAGFDWKGALINAAVSGIGAGIGGALGGGTGGYNGWTGATGSTGAIAADMSGMRFANGGGILSPIPQGLYTSETTFPMATLGRHAFARGGALTGIGKLGEAGPEFVMPAVQMANGKLGVAASGQSKAPEVKVVVNNTVAHDTEARVTQDSNGGLTLDIVRAAVAQDLYKGGTKIAKAADHAALRRGR